MKAAEVVRLTLAAIKLVLATVLAVSGFIHTGNSLLFLTAVLDYDLGGPQAAIVAAALLPFMQIVVAAALVASLTRTDREALVWAGALFGLYCLVQAFAYGRQLDISCGCFGATSERSGPNSLAWSIAGLLLSGVAMYLSRRLDFRGQALTAVGTDSKCPPAPASRTSSSPRAAP